MNVVATWTRRSLAAPLCLGIFCFLGWGIWTNPFWSSDATWGAQYVGASSVLFAPLVAAAAAYEMSVRHAPGFMEACRGTRRGTRGAFVPVVSTLICVLLAFGAAVLCVWLVASRSGGLTRVDPWVGIEMFAAYAAACFVGAAVGAVNGRRSAPLLAALLVLATPVVLGFLSSPLAAAQFSVAHSDGTSLGLQRVRVGALAAIAIHLAYCSASLVVILWAKRVRPWRPMWWVPVALVVLVAVATQWMTLPPGGSFEPSEEAQVRFSHRGGGRDAVVGV